MNWWSSKSLLWEGLAYQLEVEFRIESKALALCFTFLPSRCTVIWFIWWWFWMCCKLMWPELAPRFQWTEWWWRSLAIPDSRSGQGSAFGWKFVEEKLPETDQTDPLPFKIREMFHNFLYFQNWSRVKKHKIQETGTAEVFLPDQIIMKRGKSEAGKTMKFGVWESRRFQVE